MGFSALDHRQLDRHLLKRTKFFIAARTTEKGGGKTDRGEKSRE